MYLGKISLAILVLFISVVISACGYQFAGGGLKAPGGVGTIAITVLENRTSESGIERVFTNDLAYEFTRSKVLGVVEKDVADAVLSGVIRNMREESISHTASFASDERRVTVTLSLTLKSQGGAVLWSDSELSDREAFEVFPNDKMATERSKRAALETISERLAEKAHNRILTGF
ncbi:MAG: LPS assembly lipoprotein LptE [Deltaproteobacteria bacterium]|jgi:hypothetical protein